MSDHEMVCVIQFDAYMKTAFQNTKAYYFRRMSRVREKEVNFSDMSKSEESQLSCLDQYEVENFSRVINTAVFDAIIHSELLYGALMELSPDNREIVLLKYWRNMSDKDIGIKMSMSQQMVNYHRHKALYNLKKLIREMNENDEGFDL